ncbi:uncharacterized protein CLUP02_02324 [Colletotrichum lupini]|uniref:Uncharacterized protein n=1 Tax=Colletotrichum lupini TaxID=145971 RepID=A0A9Q8W9I7_9PEZI|nr:uncharacterized protein CLUP02_02324 [Colletotrichum lupini]UQC75668.1 hypothetical protein CLUP02_02324 [Colletotrichum lupini]
MPALISLACDYKNLESSTEPFKFSHNVLIRTQPYLTAQKQRSLNESSFPSFEVTVIEEEKQISYWIVCRGNLRGICNARWVLKNLEILKCIHDLDLGLERIFSILISIIDCTESKSGTASKFPLSNSLTDRPRRPEMAFLDLTKHDDTHSNFLFYDISMLRNIQDVSALFSSTYNLNMTIHSRYWILNEPYSGGDQDTSRNMDYGNLLYCVVPWLKYLMAMP